MGVKLKRGINADGLQHDYKHLIQGTEGIAVGYDNEGYDQKHALRQWPDTYQRCIKS